MNDVESQIEELCQKKQSLTPVDTLVELMSGRDPRTASKVFILLEQLDSQNGIDPPDEYDWLVLRELIISELKSSIVDINTVKDAAKQLMEYTHNKRKAVEVTTKTAEIVSSTKLSRRDIRLLKKEFDLEF